MSSTGHPTLIEPFFLPAGNGERLCVLYRPASARALRGAIAYVHPFAEEMNKARRTAALAAHAFAQAGYAVLQLDLFGCGDSDGELKDACWQTWKDDVRLGIAPGR